MKRIITRTCAGKYCLDYSHNHAEALEKMEKENPGLVVLGCLGSPEESAFVCRLLKNDPKYAKVPILVVDAPFGGPKGRRWRRLSGLTLEADDYVALPLPEAALLAHIEELMR